MRRGMICLLLPALVLCAGCLDFEKQTLVLKVSPDGKTAECLLVYEGFGVRDNKLEAAKGDLKTLATSEEMFYLFTSWPCRIRLTQEAGDDDRTEQYKARLRQLLTIRAEGFFETADGKVGLWQTLRTKDAPALFAELNRLLAEMLAKRASEIRAQGGTPDVDEATRTLWDALPKSPQKLLVWDAGKLRLTIPATRPTAEKMRTELIRDEAFRKLFPADTVQVAVTDQGLVITTGQAGQPVLTIICHSPANTPGPDHHTQLRDYARTLPLPVKPGVTPEKLVREFQGK